MLLHRYLCCISSSKNLFFLVLILIEEINTQKGNEMLNGRMEDQEQSAGFTHLKQQNRVLKPGLCLSHLLSLRLLLEKCHLTYPWSDPVSWVITDTHKTIPSLSPKYPQDNSEVDAVEVSLESTRIRCQGLAEQRWRCPDSVTASGNNSC